MRFIRGLTNLKTLSQSGEGPLARGCVATVGNFDGVHRGHQAILEQVKNASRKAQLALGGGDF
ncbi:MAG: adenylyltransferase/cytidyltransferase family protein [Marinobacter sp.]|nr:adenylyltransferase/cytidyltransferase family protein [Marinobacter sp.]